jgi:hypothetical protein
MQSATGEYGIPAVSESPIMDVFPYFYGEEEDLEKTKKFNALKVSRLEVAADTMEFTVYEETAS